MLNKIYLFLMLVGTVACNSGGGGSSSAPNPNPPIIENPTYTEISKSYSVPSGQSLNLNLENETFLSISTEVSSIKGSLTGTFPNLVYTANSNVTGQDQAILFLTKANATKRITLNFNFNNIPVANNFSISVVKGNGVSFDLQGSDLDGDILTYSIIQMPPSGTLYHFTSGKEAAYDAPNFSGTVSFFYQVNDGKTLSNIGKVDLIIAPSLPVITSPASYSLNEDTTTAISFTATDSTGGVTYTIVSNPANGVITGSGSNYNYTPTLNYAGLDSFKVRATNSSNGFTEKVINLTINPVSDAPIFNNMSGSTLENTDTFLIADASDPDGDLLSYTIVSQGSLGQVYLGANGRIFYSPYLNQTGVDNFSVRVCDNGQPIMCDDALIQITIIHQPKEPIAQDQEVLATAGQPIQITLTGVYYNQTGVTSQTLTQVTNGTLVKNSEFSYTYTPNFNSKVPGAVYAEDYFSFTLTEEGFTSQQAVVTLKITYTYNYLGLDFDGEFRELSGFQELFHKEEVLGYYFGQNTLIPDENPELATTEQYLAFYKDSLDCNAEEVVSYNMINFGSFSNSSSEIFTITSDYSCSGNLLQSSDLSEKAYMTDNLILRHTASNQTQFGVKVGSLVNNTTLNDLTGSSLTSVEKIIIPTISQQITIESIDFSSLISTTNIVGESTPKFFFKTTESIINYLNHEEQFEIHHEIKEINGELKLVNKYYLTTNGMRPVQLLLNEWFAIRPYPEPEDEVLAVNMDAGSIIIIDDVIFVRRTESVVSFFQVPEEDTAEYLYYFLNTIEPVLEIYNRKM